MSVAVKARPIKQSRISQLMHCTFTFKNTTPRKILNEVSSKYAQYLTAHETSIDIDEELISITDSDWYKKMNITMSPGKYLKTLREATGTTQTELGKKIGVSAARICDYEASRRDMSKTIAKKLSLLFLVPAEKFI